MRNVFAVAYKTIGIFLTAITITSCPTQLSRDKVGFVYSGNELRTYRLHLPGSYDGETKMPLVVALHPFTGTGKMMEALSGFSAIADRENFIVVYPDGINRMWTGNPQDPFELVGPPPDDVAFLSELLDELTANYTIDSKRVYVTGASAGGLMAQRCAGELTDRFAAAATAMSILPACWPDYIHPSNSIPMMVIHGDSDPFLPWEGGSINEGGSRVIDYMSVADTVAFWAANVDAKRNSQKVDMPDSDSSDGTTVFRETYPAKHGDDEVTLYGIRGGGHTWPGAGDLTPGLLVGPSCQDFDASEAMWEFFKKYKRE